MKIEVELRSFISKKKYNELETFFTVQGEYLGEDIQETVYFRAPLDLRVQKNGAGTKIWAKEGEIHTSTRHEIELFCGDRDFDSACTLFKKLGFDLSVSWWRKRKNFLWQGVTVSLDYTRNYGYIIELELCVEKNAEASVAKLKSLFQQLGIEVTPKEIFDRHYQAYVKKYENERTRYEIKKQ